MKIIVDAMGGDNAPYEIVKGSVEAVKSFDISVCLVGKEEEILTILNSLNYSAYCDKIEVINANTVICIDDDPATAIRTKKDSSLSVGLTLLRDGSGDAIVSAGSTGALLSGATLIVKRVRGVRRTALAPVLPSKKGSFILIDCGANVECTPEFLLQFAYMGTYYAKSALSIDSPRVGLLNNGAEDGKGTSLQLETYKLLGERADINFIGNIEATEALDGGCDVLVCDGYTGNIFLKTVEGTASLLMSEIKSIFYKNFITKISALMIKKHMRVLSKKLSAESVGGTALLGISKPVIKAHGSSNYVAIKNAILQAIKEAKADIASELKNSLR